MEHTAIFLSANRILAQRLSEKVGQLEKTLTATNRELARALIASQTPFELPGGRDIPSLRREKAMLEEELSDTRLIIQELRHLRRQMIRAEEKPPIQ